MSKHLQARKALTLNTGIFGFSSLGIVGLSIFKIIFKGFLGSLGFWAVLALLLVGISYFRSSWKAFGELEYQKSKSKGLMASLSNVAALVIAFLV